LRNLGRIGRLRWLAGQRSSEENWDAFEAVSGQPLLQLLQNPQPWAQVRYWLFDLATELSAAQKDGTLPPDLAFNRVWITGDGRAKLLDFAARGISASPADVAPPPAPNNTDAPRFLSQIAAAALEGRVEAAAKQTAAVSVPLPLHTRQFFKGMPQLPDTDALLLALRPLLQRVAVVTRRRRAAVMAGCIVFPLCIACLMFFVGAFMRHWTRQNPGVSELGQLLQYRSGMQSWDKTNMPVPTDRQFAIYIASHYRAAITNKTAWSNAMSLSLIDEEGGRFAQESLTQHPAPTENEIAEANAALIKSQCQWAISAEDITNLSLMIDRLRRQSDPVSAFLWQSLSNQDQIVLTKYQSSASTSNQAQSVIVDALNKLFGGPSIYEPERFKGVLLRPETTDLMKQSPTNLNLANVNRSYLNRLLLEDAYPRELSKIQYTPGVGGSFAQVMQPSFALFALAVTLILGVCLPAIIAAVAFRGGLVLLVAGVTFVRRDGAPASRVRLFWRALVTWSLLLAAPVLLLRSGSPVWAEMAAGLFCGLTLLSVVLPQRGLQDRLAGTWPVPR
jgi:hypothetical protein